MLGKCEKCPETASGVNEDGNALCSDCLFEHTCDELFGDQGVNEYLLIHEDGRQAVGTPSNDPKRWKVSRGEGFFEHWSDIDVEQCTYLHPGLVDPLIEAQRLDDEGDEGPFVWRSGHKVIDRGPMKNPVVITYKVRVIDPAQAFLELEGTCMSTGDLADSWEVPEEVVLELVARSDVERCNTCDWWCHKDELEMIDDEPKCQDCREYDQ